VISPLSGAADGADGEPLSGAMLCGAVLSGAVLWGAVVAVPLPQAATRIAAPAKSDANRSLVFILV
jgi:hypothetical protein